MRSFFHYLLVLFAVLLFSGSFAYSQERVIASSVVDGCVVNQSYPGQVSEFKLLTDSGAAPAGVQLLPETLEEQRLGVELKSGRYKEASTYLISDLLQTGESFGQISFQFVRPSPESSLFEVALVGPGLMEDKYISVRWAQDNMIRLGGTDTPEFNTKVKCPVDRLMRITINYDLQTGSYVVWANQERVFEGNDMAAKQEKAPVVGLVFSGSYMQPPDVGTFLTEWKWAVSAKPFEGPGTTR